MRNDCEICGGTNLLCLRERRDGVDIVACQHCGLVWNQEMRDPSEQIRYYREENRVGTPVRRPYLLSMLTRAACVLEFVKDKLQPGMRHLDVGCAEGTLLALTRAHGLQVTGLELDHNFSQFARDVRNIEVHPTTLDDAPLAPNSFDLVSFVHVVEHLFHPLHELGIARWLLRDDGLLYVEVPNLHTPLPSPRRFFRHKHNFYFTANSLRALVSKAGFTPLRLGYSPRDVSIQLLSAKADTAAAPSLEQWRDNPRQIFLKVNRDRHRYLLMLRLLAQHTRKELLGREVLRRYGPMLPELETVA
ncbi:MAG: class I SAM-dependent methyltransferase [Armatimonadota bacterium]|nr:class I SAM-dependent methyltransferase [Armatimonadota bacterium]